MHESSIENTWKEIVKQNNADFDLINELWLEIKKSYGSKSRHYHNLNHINCMLESSMIYNDKILDIQNVWLAIFYHDVVYSAKRRDNEEQSANFAAIQLKKLHYPSQSIEKCCNYILTTKTHINLQNDKDLDYFLDFDLQKLGSEWTEYEEYSRQIRLEYRFYPDIIYKPGRKKVLEHFLKLGKIFKTNEFIDLYEEQARYNISHELGLLV